MADQNGSKRPDGEELCNSPVPGQCNCADDHTNSHENAEEEGELEVLDDLADFLEEGGVLGFLAGGTPVHVDTEHV